MSAKSFVQFAKVSYGTDITLDEAEQFREDFFRLGLALGLARQKLKLELTSWGTPARCSDAGDICQVCTAVMSMR